MGKKSKPPPAPDYTAAAEAQSRASQDIATQQTWANRPTINTPFGSQSWQSSQSVDPATGKPVTSWAQNTTLNPQLQGALDDQFAIQGARSDIAKDGLDTLRSTLGQPVDFGNLPGIPSLPGAPKGQVLQRTLDLGSLPGMPGSAGDTRQRAEDALYQRQVRRLDPQFERDQGRLETQLANQGLARGSEAWNNAARDFNNTKEDAYSRAMLESIAGGGAEAQRDFGMDMQRRQQGYNETLGAGNFANNAGVSQANLDNQSFQQGMNLTDASMRQRQQMISEALTKRGVPLNEINALLGGQQVGMPQMPTFQGASAGQAPQYLQAAGQQYNASMDGYNAQQGQMGSMMNGLFGLGKAAIPFLF